MLKKIFFLFILVVFNSCSKNDNEDSNGNNNQNKTIVIASGQVSQVETSSVRFNEIRNDIHVGNIIVSGVAENAPVGFLRRVISIINNDSYTTVTTENSNIQDASNGLFIGTQNYSAEAISVFPNYDANSIISIANNNLNGTLKVKPSYKMNIAMGHAANGYEFTNISFVPESENDIDVNMSVQTNEIASGAWEVENIIDEPKTIYLGTLPIVVRAQVAYEIGNEIVYGNDYVNKQFIYKNKSHINAGFIYFPKVSRLTDGKITILEDNSSINAFSDSAAGISLKSKFNINLYDFTESISVEGELLLGLNISSSNNNNTVTTVRKVISGGDGKGLFFSSAFTSGQYDGNYLLFITYMGVLSSSSSTSIGINPICALVSEGYQYNTSSYNNLCYSNENWRMIHGDGLIYNNQIAYGAYIRHTPPYTELPSGWRVPNSTDYQNLINSLGNNAFAVLTDPNGFNAKPYGYLRRYSYGNTILDEPVMEDFNNKAYFATSNIINSGTSVPCLVVDFTTQTVYMQNLPLQQYLGGHGTVFMNYYYSIRLMKG